MITKSAFARATEMGTTVLLWGRTKHAHISVVLVRFNGRPRHWIAFCFDGIDGGFYNGELSHNYADGKAAWLRKLDAIGACDAPS